MTQQIDLTSIKWFVYCRKSNESEDRQIASLPAQRQDMEEIANRHHLTHIVDFFSESCSAFHPGRPLFNQMIKRLEAGEANGVLVWAANRIARNMRDGGNFIYLMDEGKLKVVMTKGRTFFNTPEDKFGLSIDFTVAKKSSDDLSIVVHRGNRYKFYEDKVWGSFAKPGFVNFTDPITKKRGIIEDPERFTLFQRAGQLIITGECTPQEALFKLNDEWGYRTRQTKKQGNLPMAESSFYKYLSDPFYCGTMSRKIEGVVSETPHTHKIMFTSEEFQSLQVRLGKKSRARQTKRAYAYKEVLKCGGCGGSITAEEKWQMICTECKTKFHHKQDTVACPKCKTKIIKMDSPKLLHYVYYRCTKKVHKECTERAIRVEQLEQDIDDELKRFEIDPDFRDWAIKHLNQLNENKIEEQDTVKHSLQGALDVADQRLTNLLRIATSPQNANYDVLSLDEIVNQKKSIVAEKEGLLTQINLLDKQRNQWFDLSIKTFDFACYARYRFAKGDLKTKTQILASLGSNLHIKDKKLRLEGHNCFCLIENAKKDIAEIVEKLEPKEKTDLQGNLYAYKPVSLRLLRD